MAVNGLPSTDVLSTNYVAGRQSCIICLAHQDLTELGAALLKRASYGATVAELRVDQLKTHGGGIASTEYVSSQIRYLRETTGLPILFTIRTASQGGKF
jgi:pentafunctional AROM polypeptide